MKKYILGLLLTAFLFAGCSATGTIIDDGTYMCRDSDDGKEYFVFGASELYSREPTLQQISVSKDYCIDSSKLREYYCIDSKTVGSTIYTCPDGCEDLGYGQGQCLKPTCTRESKCDGNSYCLRNLETCEWDCIDCVELFDENHYCGYTEYGDAICMSGEWEQITCYRCNPRMDGAVDSYVTEPDRDCPDGYSLTEPTTEQCLSGACRYNSDCDDINICTVDICDAGTCTHDRKENCQDPKECASYEEWVPYECKVPSNILYMIIPATVIVGGLIAYIIAKNRKR